MIVTCICGHAESLHESARWTYAIAVPCRRIGCACTGFTSRATGDETPAGVSDKTTTAKDID